MQHTLYIRTLKKAEHTVFCVSDGQKTYYDPQFNRLIPYSSGQQIKRAVMDALAGELEEMPSPTTFLFDVTKKGEITEGEVFAACDPTHFDQLLGGWMKAAKGGKEKTIKRRSPFPSLPCGPCIRCWPGLTEKTSPLTAVTGPTPGSLSGVRTAENWPRKRWSLCWREKTEA